MKKILPAILGTVLAFSASIACAFPDKPLKIVVPFSAGGPADQLARSFASGLADQLGQPVVVENRAGTGGIVAAQAVVQAPADGHTLFLNTNSTLLLTPMLYKKLPYKADDLKPLVIAAEAPLVVVVNGKLPVKTFSEFVSYVKQSGQKTSYASLGPGNLMQLATELLKSKSGMDTLLHVPYNGKTDVALMSLMSGDNDLFINVVSHVVPHLAAGKIRALAVTTLERLPVLPDTPTLHELGYKDFRAATFYGLALRNGTPPEVVDRLRAAAHKVMADEAFKARFNNLGLFIQPARTEKEIEQYAEAERALWASVIKQNNLVLD